MHALGEKWIEVNCIMEKSRILSYHRARSMKDTHLIIIIISMFRNKCVEYLSRQGEEILFAQPDGFRVSLVMRIY